VFVDVLNGVTKMPEVAEVVSFEDRFLSFAAHLEDKLSSSSKAKFPDCPSCWRTLSWEEGPKYVRLVVESGGSRSAYGFIEKASGDILKAESWKKPAKHARGSIYAADYGLSLLQRLQRGVPALTP
jgi:hypothetical protein